MILEPVFSHKGEVALSRETHGQYILKVARYLKREINEGEMPLCIYFKTPFCMHLHYST